MIQKKCTLVIFISVLRVGVDAIDLSCDKVDPTQPSTLRCTCVYTNGTGILWYKNGAYLSDCYLEAELCLGYTGYSFSLNSSTNEYTFSVDFYNYSNCDVYTCRDLDLPDVNDTKMITAQKPASISTVKMSEPKRNHTSGFIGITSECIYDVLFEENYPDIQWFFVMGSEEISYSPINTNITSVNGSCQLCDGEKATQFVTGFNHREETGCRGKEAKFRIVLTHGIPEQLNITTRNYYCVSGKDSPGSTRTNTHERYYVLLTVLPLLVFIFTSIRLYYTCCKDRMLRCRKQDEFRSERRNMMKADPTDN